MGARKAIKAEKIKAEKKQKAAEKKTAKKEAEGYRRSAGLPDVSA